MFKFAQAETIVSLLNDPNKPIVLLGAGASKQSGVMLVTEIVEEAAKWAYCKDNGIAFEDPRLTMSDWKKWLTKHSWYTEDYSILYPKIVEELLNPRQARKDFFLRITHPDVPASKGYEVLAQLLHLRYLDTVLTTNFDECLHDAKTQIRQPPVINLIKTPYDLTKLFSYTPRYPQLVYLHGSVEHYTDKNLIDEIQNLNPDLVNTLKPILKDRPLIIIGYRGAEPSIMQDLFLNNLDYTSNFQQGIYWCMLRKEAEKLKTDTSIATNYFLELADKAKGNFQIIPIDGFDEFFVKDIWGKLRANEIDVKSSLTVVSQKQSFFPTYDTQVIGPSTIGPLEIAIIRERIRNYSQRLGIKVYDEHEWLFEQMLRLNIAAKDQNNYQLTTSGTLLFSSQTQSYIKHAYVNIKFIGEPTWLENISSYNQDSEWTLDEFNSREIERKIQGHLWNQLNEITDLLSIVNKPFRLKGEVSENVYPYPTLALKEVIVNSLVHRDYSIEEPVTIEVRQTYIVFQSPGGLVEEVKRQLSDDSMESQIRNGKRGIKGYRNPVIADLFYGSGAMDKEGSGLSDVLEQVAINSGKVNFGPSENEKQFGVIIYRRPEEVNITTQTATPVTINGTTKFACNLFEFLRIPERIFHADTKIRFHSEISKALEDAWKPPCLINREKIWSFYNLSEWKNPLKNLVDIGTVESLSIEEFTELTDGNRELVRLLNESLIEHLFSIGLRVDTKKKRAYFTKGYDGNPKEIKYQARIKKATRTVAKPRISSTTGKIIYWEHKAFWFKIELIGSSWFLIINPTYVFTIDGIKHLLKSEKVSILSTKKASRDYNLHVHNDFTFWASYISQGNESGFLLRSNDKEVNEGKKVGPIPPDIILTTTLPTISVDDVSFNEEYIEPLDTYDFDDIDKELEKLATEEMGDKE